MRVRMLTAFSLLLVLFTPLIIAWGDETSVVSSDDESAVIKAWTGSKNNLDKSSKTGTLMATGKSKYTYVPKARYATEVKAHKIALARFQDYENALATHGECAAMANAMSCPVPLKVDAPGEFNLRPAGDRAKPVAPVITPEQAAYVAYARLRLTPPKPVIGPSPDINEWKMAAVGYPMWLSVQGNLHPAAVSDTVYDLTVTLRAHLVDVTFDMGDGHRVSCTDVTRPWVRGTTPGAASPACGYTYTQPSLPQGSYTITAHTHWAVDWTVNGVGGTIPLYQEATTTLPVGELQVLVR